MRTHYRHLLIAAALLLLNAATALGQRRTLYWVGGSGAWSDAAHWSLVERGPGGAGIPGASDDAVLRTQGEAVVGTEGNARCNSLRVDAREGFARFTGAPGNELRVHGDFVLNGSVHWAFDGTVRFSGDGQGRRGRAGRGRCRFQEVLRLEMLAPRLTPFATPRGGSGRLGAARRRPVCALNLEI